MKKKKRIDILHVIADFQKKVLSRKPSGPDMYDEVRMMGFKIKPLGGDLSLLNLKDVHLIEALWNLGKLDEFYRSRHRTLSRRDREIFLRFFDDLYHKFQTHLSQVHLVPPRDLPDPEAIEMEIFREESRSSKLN